MSAIPDPRSSFEAAVSKNASGEEANSRNATEGRDPVTGVFLTGNKRSRGRPKGSRARLSEKFFAALHDDFMENGVAAIARVRFHDPSTYISVIAKLMPQKLEITTPTDGLSDERLAEMLEFAERMAATALPGDNAKPVQVIEVKPVPAPSFSVAPPTEAAQRAEARRLDLIDQSEAANAAAPMLPSQVLPHPVGRPHPRPDHEVERINRAKLDDDVDPASLF